MVNREPPMVPEKVAYFNLSEVVCDVNDPWVVLRHTPDFLAVGLVDADGDVVVKVLFSDGSFKPHVSRNGFPVYITSADVELCDVEHIGVSRLLEHLGCQKWCVGSTPRSKMCLMISNSTDLCKYCVEAEAKLEVKNKRPLMTTTPLSSAPVPQLVQELRTIRTKLKDREQEIEAIQRSLRREAVSISPDVQTGLEEVLNSSLIEDPFLKLFWEEQKKAGSRDSRGMRWHPTMIRFAIYLHFQSPRAYEALRSTGVLHLPNKSTLRDYSNFFKAEEGFSSHVFNDLRRSASSMPPEKRYVALMLDEMAVRGDLVYDHRGGCVVGFINPQTWNFKAGVETTVASHVLVFMVVGINNNIKMSIGHFATHTATSDVLYPLMWKAIAFLEQQALKVISVTSDKASPNQRLYRLHGPEKVVHQSQNFYSAEDRMVFFISDPPHLMKTIRNNMELSKAGGKRCLWRNNQHIWWAHVFRVFNDDINNQLRRTKLREEHVHLTPRSRMSVRLAVQVLSRTVGLVLQQYYGEEVQETAKFIFDCDRVFDCLNVRSFTEHVRKRKPDLAPYRSVNDTRFQFLESFVQGLDDWKQSIDRREGFTSKEKEIMFISFQTYEGIVTTVRGFIACTKYLLNHGVPYVLSNTFCQDPLEEHFGRHRGLGQRSRNPSAYEFGHQENRLHLQRDLAFQFRPRGNTAGRDDGHNWIDVDDAPLPKLRRN